MSVLPALTDIAKRGIASRIWLRRDLFQQALTEYATGKEHWPPLLPDGFVDLSHVQLRLYNMTVLLKSRERHEA